MILKGAFVVFIFLLIAFANKETLNKITTKEMKRMKKKTESISFDFIDDDDDTDGVESS